MGSISDDIADSRSGTLCYSGDITLGASSISLSDVMVWSMSGRIDFSATSLNLTNNVTLKADNYQGDGNYAIDLSGVERLVCQESSPAFQVGNGKRILLPLEDNIEGCNFNSDVVDFVQPDEATSVGAQVAYYMTGFLGAAAFIGALIGVTYYQFNRVAGFNLNLDPDMNVHDFLQEQFDVLDYDPFAGGTGDVDLLTDVAPDPMADQLQLVHLDA